VRQKKKVQWTRPIVKIGVAVTASALMSAGAAAIFAPSDVVEMAFIPAAAINTSNTTVGFADSDIIGMSQADIDRTLDEMQAMGVQNVRILIPWNGVELVNDFFYWNKVDAIVNAAEQRDMGILGVLNSTPAWATEPGQPAPASPPASTAEYAEFVGAVAERYAGRVSAYEVWNEPNATTFWYPTPDPAKYTQLLQAAYPAIKAADPEATVIGGVVAWVLDSPYTISPASYVASMYDAGAQGSFDALSYHPYEYSVPLGQGRAYGPAAPINQLELMHQEMVANGDGDKLIWASEYGQPTSQGGEVKQAQFISNFPNTWSSVDYTGPSFIYTTRDRNTASTGIQDTLGVLRTDWTRKPAADVIQQWTATHPQTAPDPVTLTVASEEAAAEPTTTAPESTPPDTTEVAETAETATVSTDEATEPADAATPAETDGTDSTDSTDSTGSTDSSRDSTDAAA
jgi:polysaccharide biosynthesis protein PslG